MGGSGNRMSLEQSPSPLTGEIEEHRMTELKQKLFKVTEQWRRTARSTRFATKEIPNLLARGHMHGLSDGLDVAADDIEAVLDKQVSPAP